MIHLMEYIVEHYALFLGSAILILLAIIGYYADKTNFGQGKTNNEKNNERSLEGLKLSDLTSEANEEFSEEKKDIVDSELNSNSLDELEKINEQSWPKQSKQLEQEKSINTDELLDSVNSENQAENSIEVNNLDERVELKDDNIVLLNNENEINKQNTADETNENVDNNVSSELIKNSVFSSQESFDDEFDMVLPKKELINDNILSDIEEMELDKTRKIDLSGYPEFNDIELPEIKQNIIDDDIWKF